MDARAAFLRLMRARQAEMQAMIDLILAAMGDEDPPPAKRRKPAAKPQQAALF